MNPLQASSIMTILVIRKWSAEVTDKKALAAVAEQFQSNTQRDKYKKSLFTTDALSTIELCAGRIRNHFYYHTVPWLDGGKGRLLPIVDFQEFAKSHKKLRFDFEHAVEEFINDYDDLVEAARRDKGDLFNAAEYPDKDLLRDRFKVRILKLPFPGTDDIRLDAPAAEIALLKQDMDESIACVEEIVSAELQARFHKRLEMLCKTLKVGKRFNVSLLTKITDVYNKAKGIEKAVNKDLMENLEIVQKNICVLDPEAIRNSQSLQEEIISICEEML